MKYYLQAILICSLALLSSCKTSGPCISSEASTTDTKKGKEIWAYSYLWAKAPELQAEKWLTEEPDTTGKHILIEHWNTWCGPCRRSIPLLNEIHKKYCDELVVIGISDETEEKVRALKKPIIEYYSAIDTQGRQKEKLGVKGVPHIIIIEPGGYVVWEGFPLLENYELTIEKVGRLLDVGRKLKAKKKAQGR